MSEANRNQYQLFLDRKSLLVENQTEGVRASIRLEVARKLCVRAVMFVSGHMGVSGLSGARHIIPSRTPAVWATLTRLTGQHV